MKTAALLPLAAEPIHAAVLAELRAKTSAESIAINGRREAFLKANAVQTRQSAAPEGKAER